MTTIEKAAVANAAPPGVPGEDSEGHDRRNVMRSFLRVRNKFLSAAISETVTTRDERSLNRLLESAIKEDLRLILEAIEPAPPDKRSRECSDPNKRGDPSRAAVRDAWLQYFPEWLTKNLAEMKASCLYRLREDKRAARALHRKKHPLRRVRKQGRQVYVKPRGRKPSIKIEAKFNSQSATEKNFRARRC